MGRLRNQRSHKATTFLEHVCDLLHVLRVEIENVKLSIDSINGVRKEEICHPSCFATYSPSVEFARPPPAPPPLDSYSRDFLLCFRGVSDSLLEYSLPKASTIDYVPVPVFCNGEWEPLAHPDIEVNTITEQDGVNRVLQAQDQTSSSEKGRRDWNLDADVFVPCSLKLPPVMMGSRCGLNTYYLTPEAELVHNQAITPDVEQLAQEMTVAETTSMAQTRAAKYRSDEALCTRFSAEAEAAYRERCEANPDCEIPESSDEVDICRYLIAHVAIAKDEFPIEHRRPFLQQQIARLEAKFVFPKEMEQAFDEILKKFGPPTPDQKFMCSHCGAGYDESINQCSVCKGFDVFDATEIRIQVSKDVNETIGADSASDIDGSLSDTGESVMTGAHFAGCSQKFSDSLTSVLKHRRFPEFMRNPTVSSGTKKEAFYPKIGPTDLSKWSDSVHTATKLIEPPVAAQSVFFAVRGGSNPGIYASFDEAKLACKTSQNCQIKKFCDNQAALDFAGL